MIDPYPQDTKARELYRRAFADGPGMAIGAITVALKEAESAALELAAQECMKEATRFHTGFFFATAIRALAAPAAAAAAGRDPATEDADAAWRDGEAHGRDE